MLDLLYDEAPLEERAAFFIRVKTAGWSRTEEDYEVIKEAFDMSMAPGGPDTKAWEGLETRTLDRFGPMEGKRRNTLRKQIWKSRKPFREAHTATLKERGRQRGVTSLAAEAKRKKGRRGERWGKVVGAGGGAAAALTAARKVKDPKAKALAALVGAVAGGRVGKEVGTEVDIKKNAAAMRFKMASMKLAQEPAAPMAPPTADATQGTPPQQMPNNYLGAEMMAQQAQGANEGTYYRQQLQQSQQVIQGMQDQLGQVQEQTAMMQQQADQTNAQIQQATSQAVAAQDSATQNAVQAANMRIGFQKLREQVMQAASQEPEALAAPTAQAQGQVAAGAQPAQEGTPQEGGPGPAGTGMTQPGQPAPEGGPAGQAPELGAPPGSPAGGVGEGEGVEATPGTYSQQAATAAPQTQLKTGSAMQSKALWAIPGAAVGAVHAARGLRTGLAPMQSKIKQLESQRGGFAHAMRLAKAKADLALQEVAQKHPVKAIGMGALKGGAMSAALGPKAMKEIGRSGQIMSDLRGLR